MSSTDTPREQIEKIVTAEYYSPNAEPAAKRIDRLMHLIEQDRVERENVLLDKVETELKLCVVHNSGLMYVDKRTIEAIFSNFRKRAELKKQRKEASNE